jgi:hypothetical protein
LQERSEAIDLRSPKLVGLSHRIWALEKIQQPRGNVADEDRLEFRRAAADQGRTGLLLIIAANLQKK